VATPDPDTLSAAAGARGIATSVLGRAGGDRLVVEGLLDVAMDALREAYEGNLATALGDT